MSGASSTVGNEHSAGVTDGSHPRGPTAGVTDALEFAGFWTAVCLPVTYLPLLLTGFGGSRATAFASLLVVHVAALVLGQGYHRD